MIITERIVNLSQRQHAIEIIHNLFGRPAQPGLFYYGLHTHAGAPNRGPATVYTLNTDNVRMLRADGRTQGLTQSFYFAIESPHFLPQQPQFRMNLRGIDFHSH